LLVLALVLALVLVLVLVLADHGHAFGCRSAADSLTRQPADG